MSAAAEVELVGDVVHEGERVVAVAPRSNVRNPRLLGYLFAVHVGDDENGVPLLRDEQEQVAFGGVFIEAGDVEQVRTRKEDERVGLDRLQSLLTPAGSLRESVGHDSTVVAAVVKVHSSATPAVEVPVRYRETEKTGNEGRRAGKVTRLRSDSRNGGRFRPRPVRVFRFGPDRRR